MIFSLLKINEDRIICGDSSGYLHIVDINKFDVLSRLILNDGIDDLEYIRRFGDINEKYRDVCIFSM